LGLQPLVAIPGAAIPRELPSVVIRSVNNHDAGCLSIPLRQGNYTIARRRDNRDNPG
jgi:hypothetical protein